MKGVRSVAGIVSALGWRWGVLWWAPFAVFLLLAARARLVVGDWEVNPGYFSHHDVAATWYLYLTLAQVPVLWLRTRFAIGLGYDRRAVFFVVALATAALVAVEVLLNASATHLEVLAQGDQGVLVTSTGIGKFPEPGPPPLISFGAVLALTFGPPIAAALGLTTSWALRWGAVGVVVGVLASLAFFSIAFLVVAAMPMVGTVPVAPTIVSAALMAATWPAVRSQPV